MEQIQFYALRGDLLPLLEAVERDGPLQYARLDNSLSSDIEVFHRGLDIPDLGKADRDTGSVCAAFVVAQATLPLTVRTITVGGHVQRYCMDQLSNPDSVVLRPAGLWGEDVVLNGQVGTASDSPISQALMKRFTSAFNEHFRKVKAYRVGPNALAILNAGRRLTISEQSPRLFDLRF